MNYFMRSINELKRMILENKYLSKEDWNKYAHKLGFYSASTLIIQFNAKNWEDLINKAKTVGLDNNYKEIKEIRKKLNESVLKHGLNSPNTRELSNIMDILINDYYRNMSIRKYPNDNEIVKCYYESYKHLKSFTIDINKFPTEKEWSQYAKRGMCLNAVSMQYVSKLNWNKLRNRVFTELKLKIF